MISHPHADLDASRDVTIVTVTRADQAQSIRRGIGKRLPPKVRCAGAWVTERGVSSGPGRARAGHGRAGQQGRKQGDEARDGHLRLAPDWIGLMVTGRWL